MKRILARIITAIIAIPIGLAGLLYYIIKGNETNSNNNSRGKS